MFMAYLGVIDCVEQMRIANAEAVREAWLYVFAIIIMSAVLCAAVWAVCRVVRRKVCRPSARIALAILALGTIAWGGTKIVTQKGINLTKCEADSKKVVLEWSTEDERIRPGAKFMIQASRDGRGVYETVATTTASNAVIPRFTVDKTHVWRIAVDAGEVQVDEGGTE